MEKFYMGAANLPKILPQYCGRKQCAPNHRVDKKVLERYVVHYVVSGCGTFYKHEKTYHVVADELFISCPDEQGTHIADAHDPWDYIWVSFTGPQDFALLQQDVVSIPGAKRLFLQMINAKDDPARDWIVHGLLYQLFAMLSANLDNPSQQKDYLREAISYIEENYDQHLQVDQIAKTVGMSRSHFSRLFKRQTGFSPQDYIVAYRLEKAAQLLADTTLTQKEVAGKLGYPDVSTFSRMFKRKYGVPPGKYRQSCTQLPLIHE